MLVCLSVLSAWTRGLRDRRRGTGRRGGPLEEIERREDKYERREEKGEREEGREREKGVG